MAQLIHSVLSQPKRPIVYVEPALSVAKCVEMMTSNDIGALVVRDGQSLVGMISERDIVRACVRYGLSPEKTSAGDIAFKEVSILSVDDPVEMAMEIITLTKRRHVLVQEKNELVAILSIGDLLFHLLDDKSRVIEHLENYIHH